MTRALRPRATSSLALAPATVTDRTAPLVLGLEPRVFRELVAARRIRHAVVGRRLVARVDDVLEALGLGDASSLDDERGESERPSASTVASAPRRAGVDAILARIGRTTRRAAS